jgi:hypothetical protein
VRYYKIDITTASSGAQVLPSSLGGLPISSLLSNGQTNPGALQVEFDIPVAALHAPDGQAIVRIWGLSIADLTGSFNLNPSMGGQPTTNVTVSGGMATGLPLANPAQAGVLVTGSVQQAFGNWIGTDQTVDFILGPALQGGPNTPVNYSLDWKKGTTLASALGATLTAALPNAQQTIAISPNLVLNYDMPGYYGSLTQLAQMLNPLSKSIISTPNYLGVSIFYDGTTVNVTDYTTPPTATTQIQFTDLIGQPTWIGPLTIQAKCVMRGDVSLGDTVTLPPSLVTSSSAAFQGLTGSNPANNLTFSGPYLVQSVHHYGNFRQPDAASWATVLEMVKQPTG